MKQNYPPQSLGKQWKLAANKKGQASQKGENAMTELAYKKVLTLAKQLLSQQPQIVCERNMRENNDNAFTMHFFISPTLYLELECSIMHYYRVNFAFNACKHEPELRSLLSDFPLQGKSIEIDLQPNFEALYNRVLSYQKPEFTYLLKG